MEEKILELLKKSRKAISIEDLLEKLEMKTSAEREKAKKTVQKLILNYKVYCTPNLNLRLMSKTSFKIGYFYKDKKGNGTVSVISTYEDKEGKNIVKQEKYKIKDNKDALDGDEVLIDVNYKDKTARVNKIISRNINNVIGKVYKIGESYFVKPSNLKKADLTIAIEEGQWEEGISVKVELIDQRADNFYTGKIIKVFDQKDAPKQKILLEAIKCGMPEGFSKESEEQLKNIPISVRKEDFIGRRDLTKWKIFSIDGKATKDRDDCISLDKLPNGHVLLGVHIADVAYYVPENSPIDKDAFLKGTSYYFGGGVEPQLPPKLSNGICSLDAGENRLTKTVLIEYDEDGNIVSREIFKSVIKSKAAMNYEDVNKFLMEGKPVPEYEPYYDTLLEAKKLSEKLYQKRIENGAMLFDEVEVDFEYDEEKNPIDVTYRYQGVSEKIIEEFMIAANRSIGELLNKQNLPCIYRVHGKPNQKDLGSYLKFLSLIGISYPKSGDRNNIFLQALTSCIKDDKISPQVRQFLNRELIKCMDEAKYSTKNKGHYGIGSTWYSHFTSPIRRLADYGINRILDECYFETDLTRKTKNIKKWQEQAVIYAEQANKMEHVEEEVERRIDAINKARLLSNYIGQEFEGTIIEITGGGIKVQLDNLLIGYIRFRNLPGIYEFDKEHLTLLSLNSLENYYIGDRLKLQLFDTNIEKGFVDFKVIEKISENNYYQKNYTEEERKAASKKVKLKIRRNNNNRSQYYY